MLTRRQMVATSAIGLGVKAAEHSFIGQIISGFAVNAIDFGLRDDRSRSFHVELQNAIDMVAAHGGGRVMVPAAATSNGRYYRINRPLVLKSGVILEGEGPSSLLVNDLPKSNQFAANFLILPGTYHPAFYQRLRYAPLANTPSGSTSVRLLRSDVLRFSVGDTVVLRGNRWSRSFDGFINPHWQRLNEVVAINSANGTLELRYPVDRDLVSRNGRPAAEIAATDTADVRWTGRIPDMASIPMSVLKRGGLRGLGLRSNGPIMGDSATLDCVFDDLDIVAERGVYGNSFCWSRFSKIRMHVQTKAIETSGGSHDSVFTDIEVNIRPDWIGDKLHLCAIQEYASRVVIDGFQINAGKWAAGVAALRIAQGSANCVIRNGTIVAENARGSLIEFAMTKPRLGDDPGVLRENIVENVSVNCGSARTNVFHLNFNNADQAVGCRISAIHMTGTGYLRAGIVNGIGSVVERCVSHRLGAPLQILETARNCLIRDNQIVGGILLQSRSLIFANQIEDTNLIAPS